MESIREEVIGEDIISTISRASIPKVARSRHPSDFDSINLAQSYKSMVNHEKIIDEQEEGDNRSFGENNEPTLDGDGSLPKY